jgi:hypothetical protein
MSEAIRALKAEGLRIVMMTGDSRTTAGAVAAKLDLDEVIAEVLPDQKAVHVERLQRLGRSGRALSADRMAAVADARSAGDEPVIGVGDRQRAAAARPAHRGLNAYHPFALLHVARYDSLVQPGDVMHLAKLAALLLSVSLAACGGSSSSAGPTTTPTKTATADDPSCPVSVAGTSVTVEDAANGAALVFVTTGDVAEVRKRVATLAAMHNEHHSAMGPLPDGTDAGGGHAGHDAHAHHGGAGGGGGGAHAGHAGGMIGVHSKATAADIDGGAKVTFVANGGDVGKLQSELRMHAQHLAGGTCQMGTMGKS